jgi:hypothetical protein
MAADVIVLEAWMRAGGGVMEDWEFTTVMHYAGDNVDIKPIRRQYRSRARLIARAFI